MKICLLTGCGVIHAVTLAKENPTFEYRRGCFYAAFTCFQRVHDASLHHKFGTNVQKTAKQLKHRVPLHQNKTPTYLELLLNHSKQNIFDMHDFGEITHQNVMFLQLLTVWCFLYNFVFLWCNAL